MKAIALALALLSGVACAQKSPSAPMRSGSFFQSDTIRAMQNDDIQNPGLLWVDAGREAFSKDCASCHATPNTLALKLPRAIDEARAENLDDAINRCTTTRLNRAAHAPESRALLSLSAFLHHAARDQQRTTSSQTLRSSPFQQGFSFWHARQGKQDLSCALCHDQLAGKTLRNQTISQGHSNGYPTYRLEWQTIGSVERRIRACLFGMEANVLPPGDVQLRALELYLASRSAPLPIEAPAVRR
jgi:L-cysteine S-thiosulfotransferase